MTSARLHVDRAGRRVVWRPASRQLWLRAGAFVVLGIVVPVLVLGGGERPIFVTVPMLLMTAATAAWLVAALRQGWELDEHGIESDIGRRTTRRFAWTEIDALAVDDADLVATTRDGRHFTIASDDPVILRDALAAAGDLGIVPTHVTVPTDEAGGS